MNQARTDLVTKMDEEGREFSETEESDSEEPTSGIVSHSDSMKRSKIATRYVQGVRLKAPVKAGMDRAVKVRYMVKASDQP